MEVMEDGELQLKCVENFSSTERQVILWHRHRNRLNIIKQLIHNHMSTNVENKATRK